MKENKTDEMLDQEYKRNITRIKIIAEEKEYMLNPDKERVKKVVEGMTKNYIEYKKYYCPCKQSHPLNTETDVTCPCPDLEREVENDGNCNCRLFFREKSK